MSRNEVAQLVNAAWCAVVFLMALAKLLAVKIAVQAFRDWGLLPHLTTIGVLEIVLVVLYVRHNTMRLGFFLLCSFFGGAVATLLQHGGRPWGPLAMLIALWIAAYLREPALFTRTEGRVHEWDYLRTKT